MSEKSHQQRYRSIYTVNEKITDSHDDKDKIDYNSKWLKHLEATDENGVNYIPTFKPKCKQSSDNQYESTWQETLPVGSYGDYIYSYSTETDVPGTAVVTPHGTMSLRLRNQIKVDMTVDGSIRIINKKNNVGMALNCYGCRAAFLHPHGRVYQNGATVEMLIYDKINFSNKFAKMGYKGICFKNDINVLKYLLDAAGTRSTSETFLDLNPDFSLSVFYDESRYGPELVQEAVTTLQSAAYWDNGVEHWKIKNIIITQTDDVINVFKNGSKYQMKTTNSASAMLSTPFIHCTASKDHMFIRRGDRRMHFDGVNFIVRNAGHSAGFDENNILKIF